MVVRALQNRASDVAVVRFSQCEDSGVQLENCPLYTREWIKQEKEKR